MFACSFQLRAIVLINGTVSSLYGAFLALPIRFYDCYLLGTCLLTLLSEEEHKEWELIDSENECSKVSSRTSFN